MLDVWDVVENIKGFNEKKCGCKIKLYMQKLCLSFIHVKAFLFYSESSVLIIFFSM